MAYLVPTEISVSEVRRSTVGAVAKQGISGKKDATGSASSATANPDHQDDQAGTRTCGAKLMAHGCLLQAVWSGIPVKLQLIMEATSP